MSGKFLYSKVSFIFIIAADTRWESYGLAGVCQNVTLLGSFYNTIEAGREKGVTVAGRWKSRLATQASLVRQ